MVCPGSVQDRSILKRQGDKERMHDTRIGLCQHTLTAYSRSGVACTDEDKQLNRNYLEEIEKEIEQLEEQLADKKRMAALLRGSIAPIRRLPDELLTRIFLFATPHICVHFTNCESPWNIGGACKHWYDVLYSSPEVWSVLRLDWSKLSERSLSWGIKSPYISRFAKLLELSRNLPLYIQLPAGHPSPKSDYWASQNPLHVKIKEAWYSIYQLLEGQYHRWHGRIDGSLFCHLTMNHTNSTHTLPNITHVHHDPASIRALADSGITVNFPGLVTLVLSLDVAAVKPRVEGLFVFNQIRLFLGQHSQTLEQLEFHEYESNPWPEFFAMIPELKVRHLTVIGCNKRPTAHYTRQRAHPESDILLQFLPFQYITYLSLTNHHLKLVNTLAIINFPYLTKLSIMVQSATAEGPEVGIAVGQMIQTSSCQATLKSIAMAHCPADSLLHILPFTQNLEEFSVPKISPSVVELLMECALTFDAPASPNPCGEKGIGEQGNMKQVIRTPAFAPRLDTVIMLRSIYDDVSPLTEILRLRFPGQTPTPVSNVRIGRKDIDTSQVYKVATGMSIGPRWDNFSERDWKLDRVQM